MPKLTKHDNIEINGGKKCTKTSDNVKISITVA